MGYQGIPPMVPWTKHKTRTAYKCRMNVGKNNSIDSSLLGEEVKCPAMNQDLYGNDISGKKKVVSSWQECGKLFFQK